MKKENVTLETFLEEIMDLKEAKELLEQLFIELGPYQNGKISQNTWLEICNYFEFDDSE